MNDMAQTGATTGSGAACLARARALMPLLTAAASRFEAGCELPADVLEAMH